MCVDASQDATKDGITNVMADTGYRGWLLESQYHFTEKQDAIEMIKTLKRNDNTIKRAGL